MKKEWWEIKMKRDESACKGEVNCMRRVKKALQKRKEKNACIKKQLILGRKWGKYIRKEKNLCKVNYMRKVKKIGQKKKKCVSRKSYLMNAW